MKYHSYFSNIEPTVSRIMCLHNMIGLLEDLKIVEETMSLGYYHGDVYYFFIKFKSGDLGSDHDIAMGPGYYKALEL